MAFQFAQTVLFRHCDPAGIVFYPRYFEMMNDCIEAFFEDALDMPWHVLHRTGAVPTAQIETRFTATSRQGDHLMLTLHVTHVGRSSFAYRMTGNCVAEQRFVTTGTLVHVNDKGRPSPWPDAPRARLVAQAAMTDNSGTPDGTGK